MLDPKNNRINFGHALRPIEGYEVDYVIGTSYTLDLEAIMFLPVSLFFGEDMKIEKYCSNELLTALTQVPQKVQLFCQRGKIAAPWFYHNILEFWGDNIEQIQMEEYSQSFHPKIWLIRYVSHDKKKATKYRFICTSRNLSKSTDWDLAITLEGIVDKTVVEVNRPLLNFIQFLDTKANRKIKKEFLSEILKIHFELQPGQDSYQFFPIGYGHPHPLFTNDFKATELLVISPFLHAESVQLLGKKTNNLTLLSTNYELDKLPLSVTDNADEIYQFNPLLELDISTASEDSSSQDLSDSNVEAEEEYSLGNSLHAKLYVAKQGRMISWYIGSANCTNPAQSGRNIEFLTAITSSEKALMSPKEILIQLTENENNHQGIFVPYQKLEQVSNAEQEQVDLDTRRTIFDISMLEIIASVSENEENLYNYHISIPTSKLFKREFWKIFMQPLSGMKGKMEEIMNTTKEQQIHFEGYELHRLTPYFLFIIKDKEVIVKTFVLKFSIDFPEGRMKKVFSSLVGNWEKLMKYLSFLLSKDQVDPIINLSDEDEPGGPTRFTKGWHAQFPLYEKLLVAASRDMSSLKQTIKIVEMLSDEKDINDNPLIEDNFKSLIETFKEIVPDDN